jgi:hypothetical protein
MSNKKLYSATFSNTIVTAQGLRNSIGEILNSGHTFKLNVLTWDSQYFKAADGTPYNVSTNATQQNNLSILSGSLTQISLPVSNISGSSIGTLTNGGKLMIFTPGQYYFDNFLFSNKLQFTLNQQNFDAVNDVQQVHTLVFEIEDLD